MLVANEIICYLLKYMLGSKQRLRGLCIDSINCFLNHGLFEGLKHVLAAHVIFCCGLKHLKHKLPTEEIRTEIDRSELLSIIIIIIIITVSSLYPA